MAKYVTGNPRWGEYIVGVRNPFRDDPAFRLIYERDVTDCKDCHESWQCQFRDRARRFRRLANN